MTNDDAFHACMAFDRARRRAIAARVEPFRWGTTYLHPQFRLVWDLNHVAVERASQDLTDEALIAEMDEVLDRAGVLHRKVTFEDSAAAAPLIPAFEARAGWMVQSLAFMVLSELPDPGSDTAAVRELDRETHMKASAEMMREMPYGSDLETVSQLVDKDDLIRAAVRTRYFGADADDGVVSVCQLYSDGSTFQIEDVGTLEAYRGRGYARAVVTRAAREALRSGADLVFLVADDDDWPKLFYERLGFGVVGKTCDFVLPAEESGAGHAA